MKSVEKSEKLIPNKVIGFKLPPFKHIIDPEYTILYALNIGFNEDQLNTKHFKFTFELNDEFSVFPTYISNIKTQETYKLFAACEGIPKIDRASVLYAEEWLEIVKPLPISGEVLYEMQIVDMEDKGKGTIFCIETRVKGIDDGTLYSVIHSIGYIKGLKGEGIKSNGILKGGVLKKIPKENPLKEINLKISPNAALFFRIGSFPGNPHNYDPKISAKSGYEKPILQGLVTHGMVAKAAYDNFCDDQIDNLLSYKTKFTSHVFPGETLSIKFWKNGQNSLFVSVSTVERKVQVLCGEFLFKNPKF